jgi:putative transposase
MIEEIPTTSFARNAGRDDPGSTPADPGSARASRAISGASPEISEDINYSKRRLPHFERPWAKYAISFSTKDRCDLTASERDIVLASILYADNCNQCQLYVACVMPDHVHLLFEPQIKEQDGAGRTVFWSLRDILHGIKSVSAHRINKFSKKEGPVWERESFDRLIRSEADFREKFRYICRNPWNSGVVGPRDDYRWLWTQEMSSAGAPKTAREARALPERSSFSRKANSEHPLVNKTRL